jgi:anaerobic selenocysteine-containing dehydrogenase
MNLMMWPNSNRLRKALEFLEFFSVCDFFESPTSDLATVYFPAATHLEREALIVSGGGRIQHRRPAVPPRGDALGDSELIFDMAQALEMKGDFWEGGLLDSFQKRLAGTGVSLPDLPENGGPFSLPLQAPPERIYLKNGFGTPTGKVEFVSTILEKSGHDGLPIYREPFWSPVSAPEVARSYPLVLTSGARTKTYTHSQARQLEVLRNREPEPFLQIHPLDAADRGITDGDPVSLSSPLGTVTMRAAVTGSLAPGVVSAPHGWAKADVNQLIPDAGLDPISGFPPFKSSLCQVARRR